MAAHKCLNSDDVRHTELTLEGALLDPCLCRECVDSLKLATTYCSPPCAEADFQRHRESVHMPARESRGMIVIDGDSLVYADDEHTKYHAKDIRDHIYSAPVRCSQLSKEYGLDLINTVVATHHA